MKNFVLVFIFVSVASILAKEDYTTRYDNIDLRLILNNKRLLKNYTNCLLDKGDCSSDGTELKSYLPDIIETGCSKCNERQRNGSLIILRHLIDNEPKIWKLLEEKYDPSGTYRLKYMEEAKKEGVHL